MKAKPKSINVLYFTDSSKTHSFQLPLTRLYLALFSFLFLVFFCIFSAVALFQTHMHIESLNSHFEQITAALFNYQARFDNVFEHAYANPNSNENSDLDTDSKTSPAENKEESIEAVSIAKKTQDAPTFAEIKAVKVSKKEDHSLLFEFEIHNKLSPRKIEGSFSAQLTIEANGSEKILTYPPENKQYLSFFRIRYFKKAQIHFGHFLRPKEVLKRIVLTVKNKDNKSYKTTTVLNKKLNNIPFYQGTKKIYNGIKIPTLNFSKN